jgi:hypothetical protein
MSQMLVYYLISGLSGACFLMFRESSCKIQGYVAYWYGANVFLFSGE